MQNRNALGGEVSVNEPDATSRGIFLTTVLRRRTLCREHFELTLGLPDFPPAMPGQFLQVLCCVPVSPDDATASERGEASPMLRRPFSIGGLRRTHNGVEIDLLGRVVGPGTAWLDARRAGDVVDVLGPLGGTFSMPPSDQLALLVAGGIGLPPIRWLAEILNQSGVKSKSIFGAQSKDLIPLDMTTEPDASGRPSHCVEEFSRENVPTAITTDDGSCGLRGRVTDALAALLSDASAMRVYACGPEPMLRAVGEMCTTRGVHCELAMERVMACGMGTCQSCVVPVNDPARENGWRYALCCTEGPVFRAEAVRWQ